MVKIVLDGFGGDYAPVETVAGAVKAIGKNSDIVVVITGKEEEIKAELSKYQYNAEQIEIVNATEVIDNNESPTVAIRTKKDSSLVKAFDYANNNDAIGIVSAGSTGAVLTGGFMKFGRIRGIHRPACCPVFPSIKGNIISICDSGANMDCKPEYLEQFGVMASAYQNVLGCENPKVALLNVGTEDHKGDTLTKEAFALLSARDDISFVGNIEARQMMGGEYDVIVCDGFAGNVLLKSAEGAMKGLLKTLKTEIKASFVSKIGALFMRKTFKKIKSQFDYSNYGGAVLLGCKKLLVKGHGNSKSDSIAACIGQVYSMHKGQLIEKITEKLGSVGVENTDE